MYKGPNVTTGKAATKFLKRFGGNLIHVAASRFEPTTTQFVNECSTF